MPPDVSICIATYRRPRGLARLLESLDRLKIPEGLGVEVLVVDNQAGATARRHAYSCVHPLRWFEEPRRNIAHARNRAVIEARGRWLAFIDDDETADEEWLAGYWRAVEEQDADGLFGPVLPVLEEVATPWLDVESFYARPRHASGASLGAADLRTSNAFLRRALFRERAFDPRLGRSGGSDTELFSHLLARGSRFRWCDEAGVREHVPRERHRLRWLSRRAFRGGCVSTALERRRRPRAAWLRGLPRALAAGAALSLALPLAALGGRRAAARVWLRLCVQAGHLWGFSGLGFEEYGGGAR